MNPEEFAKLNGVKLYSYQIQMLSSIDNKINLFGGGSRKQINRHSNLHQTRSTNDAVNWYDYVTKALSRKVNLITGYYY